MVWQKKNAFGIFITSDAEPKLAWDWVGTAKIRDSSGSFGIRDALECTECFQVSIGEIIEIGYRKVSKNDARDLGTVDKRRQGAMM